MESNQFDTVLKIRPNATINAPMKTTGFHSALDSHRS